MNIDQLIQSGTTNITIAVTPADLRDFARSIFEQCQQEMNTQEPQDTFLSRKKVRELLHVTDTTLWRWNANGYLRQTKVGKKVMYRESDVNRMMSGMGD